MQMLATLLLLLSLIAANAAQSKSNSQYNPYQYDKTLPLFTPDGRLMQLEYAKLAPEHSYPVVVVAIKNDMILFCIVRSQQQHDIKHNLTQERLIVIHGTPSDSTTGVVVVLSGVLADSLLDCKYGCSEMSEECIWWWHSPLWLLFFGCRCDHKPVR
jgi:Proteasome subunit A N-terminal signature